MALGRGAITVTIKYRPMRSFDESLHKVRELTVGHALALSRASRASFSSKTKFPKLEESSRRRHSRALNHGPVHGISIAVLLKISSPDPKDSVRKRSSVSKVETRTYFSIFLLRYLQYQLYCTVVTRL